MHQCWFSWNCVYGVYVLNVLGNIALTMSKSQRTKGAMYSVCTDNVLSQKSTDLKIGSDIQRTLQYNESNNMHGVKATVQLPKQYYAQ